MLERRFPFSSFPYGWFQLAYSDELAREAVLPVQALGRNFVLFRTETGKPHLLDAYCPHLGAHLGHGGRVQGETVQCPFHGWRIDGEGACVGIPYADTIPPKARIASWPLRETNGLILFYHHPENAAPSWTVEDLPEYLSTDWEACARKKWRLRSHVQEILENIVDQVHFRSVHGMEGVYETKVSADRHILRSLSKTKMRTPKGDVDSEIRWEAHGPGYGWIRFSGIVETLFLNAVTPVDEEFVEIRFTFFQKKNDPAGVKTAMIEEIAHQVDQDIPIWENKIYRARPLLVRGEGAVATFRQWSRQFLQ